jgi:hypothetical protein
MRPISLIIDAAGVGQLPRRSNGTQEQIIPLSVPTHHSRERLPIQVPQENGKYFCRTSVNYVTLVSRKAR